MERGSDEVNLLIQNLRGRKGRDEVYFLIQNLRGGGREEC